jgi:hypothetical protein
MRARVAVPAAGFVDLLVLLIIIIIVIIAMIMVRPRPAGEDSQKAAGKEGG